MIAFRPILSALWRSRIAFILLAMQIALTLAIVCNAMNVMALRFALMQRATGMNEADTFVLRSEGFGSAFNAAANTTADMLLLRNLPGVEAAAPVIAVPLLGDGWTEDVYLREDQKTPTTDDVAVYFSDEHGIDAYATNLVGGRNFSASEVRPRDEQDEHWPPNVIISAALAQRLFPAESALGKSFFIDRKARVTVIGIVDRLQAADAHHTNVAGDINLVEYSILVPQIFSSGSAALYLIRATPGRRDEVMQTTVSALRASNASRMIEEGETTASLRARAYAEDRAMLLILGGVVFALLTITALGIAGVANFRVTERYKQIGIRRALGATCADILHYFQAENFIITTLGLIIGSALTYAIALILMREAQTALLPWYYLPVGCACLWLLGQLAVIGPALTATRVPPAVATRAG